MRRPGASSRRRPTTRSCSRSSLRQRRHRDDDRVVRRDAGAGCQDRRHGRRRDADRRAAGTQSDGGRRRHRKPQWQRRCSRLPTPSRYTPFTDARDHRLMAFRLLVRDFNDGIERGTSPAPNFTDGVALPGSARRRARVVAFRAQDRYRLNGPTTPIPYRAFKARQLASTASGDTYLQCNAVGDRRGTSPCRTRR